MADPRLKTQIISRILKSRPPGNQSLEQVLMDAKSVIRQLKRVGRLLEGKKVIFIGDDDHISLLFSYFFSTDSYVLELDERITNSHARWENELGLVNHHIYNYDAQNPIGRKLNIDFDFFYVNPPYGSKNRGYGSRVWVSRGLEKLKNDGRGIIILPIQLHKQWSLDNLNLIERFLIRNNCFIFAIDKDCHRYLGLSEKEPDLISSSIYIKKTGPSKFLIKKARYCLYR